MTTSLSRVSRLAGYSVAATAVGQVGADIQYSTDSMTFQTNDSFSFSMGDHSVDVYARSYTGDWDYALVHFQGDLSTSFNGKLEKGQQVDSLSWDQDALLWYRLGYRDTGYNPTDGTYSFTNIISQVSALGVGDQGYFGVKFQISSNNYRYGWIDVQRDSNDTLTINGWAYEDSGEMINAGEIPAPGAIGLLALAGGASGIRRKRVS